MRKLPDICPTDNPDLVALEDKRSLFEYGLENGLSPAGLRNVSGVGDITLSVWREEVTRSLRQSIESRQTPEPKPTETKKETVIMKSNTHRSREEKIAILNEWSRDGLTIAEAARRAGVSAPTIKAWSKNLGYNEAAKPAQVKQTTAGNGAPAPTKNAPKAVEVNDLRDVVITRPDGTRIELALTAVEITSLLAA